MNSQPSLRTNNSDSILDWDSLNSLLTDEDREEMQIERVSIHMAALMSLSGKNRNQMAEMLGVNRSRISAILNGTKNLQVKSIYRFANALGYSFDIVFRRETDPTPAQPWNKVVNTKVIAALDASAMYKSGQISNEVFAISTEHAPSNMIQINQQVPNSGNTINFAYNMALNAE